MCLPPKSAAIQPYFFSLFVILLCIQLSSCISNKKLVYLRDEEMKLDEVKTYQPQNIEDYRIQANDVLSIEVLSPDPNVTGMFNGKGKNTNNMSFRQAEAAFFLTGYSVSEQGNVTLPFAGPIAVRGKTVAQANDAIQLEINNYLKNSTVITKLVSFNITILGEVRAPGRYTVFHSKASIFHGIGLAGDLSPRGKRQVKVIRQTDAGSDVFVVDLTDPQLLEKKAYYLQPNDIIYVEPMGAVTSRNNLSLLTTFFAGISTLVLVLNYLQ